jgi:UDP-2,3-diacylglucosamine pyrophosphatase LpxH
MLVVISDLHFEEETSDQIPGTQNKHAVAFKRNLPAIAFQQVVADLAGEAVRNKAKRLDLVLAGDIFDLHRTQLWFEEDASPLRPYVACDEIAGSLDLERKLLQILTAITLEPEVAQSLEVFRRLSGGRYVEEPGKPRARDVDFPVQVKLHYLPGNHDRLANATPRMRIRVRESLGLSPGGDSPFPHVLVCADPRVLVRHGHEYDRFNFSADYSGRAIPASIGESEYGQPTFGDFVTVQLASRLPNLFRKYHGDRAILDSPVLRMLYVRLLEFDDLRPQSALPDFMLEIPGSGLLETAIWRELRPVIRLLLDELSEQEFLWRWLHRLRVSWLIRLALWSRVWRLGLPLWLIRLAAGRMSSDAEGPERFAAREEVIREKRARLVIAGHTHQPQVAHLSTTEGLKQYYVDTGTWRNRVLASDRRTSFGRLKALTYVVVYGSDEDASHRHPTASKQESFDFWSGFTQRWPVADREG